MDESALAVPGDVAVGPARRSIEAAASLLAARRLRASLKFRSPTGDVRPDAGPTLQRADPQGHDGSSAHHAPLVVLLELPPGERNRIPLTKVLNTRREVDVVRDQHRAPRSKLAR